MENERIVVYMGDARVYNMMVTAAKSLLSHTEVDRVFFLTDTIDFPEELPDIIRCVNVHNQKIIRLPNPNLHSGYGYMTLMRAALSKVFPDKDRVLLLDPDTIVVDDIAPIWETDISEYYFAAVQETRNHLHREVPYWNAGVMLMNLDKLRKNTRWKRTVREIESKYYTHLEQDVLNFKCAGKILSLPSEYNASFVSDETDRPRILHFLSNSKDGFRKYEEEYKGKEWAV